MGLSTQTETPNYSGIYEIRCIETGKVYVGSAVDIRRRWILHRNTLGRGVHHSILLQRAWAKYGADKFIFSVIENVDTRDLIKREQYYIDSMKAANRTFGYNVNPSAGSGLGYRHSDEAKNKISISKLGKHATEKARMNQSISHIGKGAGEKNPNYGKHPSEEVKQKNREAHIGRHPSAETLEKMRKANIGKNLGKKRSIESVMKMSRRKAKLDEKQVLDIVRMLSEGKSHTVIGKSVGCSHGTVSDIKCGKFIAYRWALKLMEA